MEVICLELRVVLIPNIMYLAYLGFRRKWHSSIRNFPPSLYCEQWKVNSLTYMFQYSSNIPCHSNVNYERVHTDTVPYNPGYMEFSSIIHFLTAATPFNTLMLNDNVPSGCLIMIIHNEAIFLLIQAPHQFIMSERFYKCCGILRSCVGLHISSSIL